MAINDNFNFGGVVNSIYTYPTQKWQICWYCGGDGVRSCCGGCKCCESTCHNCGGTGKVRTYNHQWTPTYVWPPTIAGGFTVSSDGTTTNDNKITLNATATG